MKGMVTLDVGIDCQVILNSANEFLYEHSYHSEADHPETLRKCDGGNKRVLLLFDIITKNDDMTHVMPVNRTENAA